MRKVLTQTIAATALTTSAVAIAQTSASPGNILTSPTKDVALTLSEGTWMSVDVSPDGETLVFDLLNDIYVMPVSGGEARAILSGPATQRSPQFSPDGRHIVFLSDESGADNIWIADPDGNNARQVTRETLAMITGPSWSGDGKAIVATHTNASVGEMSKSSLRRYALDGTDAELVEKPKSGKDIQEPRYSRDGRYLYYTERVGGAHFVYMNTGLSNFVIRQRDLQTGKTVDLIAGFGSATTPQVSPDGNSIAFIRRVGAKTVLFRYDLATRTQNAVFDGLDRDLQADYLAQEHYYPAYAWFPDNRHVAIWAKGKLVKVDMRDGGATDIPFNLTAHMKVHQANRPKLDLQPNRVEAKIVRQIAPSPDGREIVFRALGSLWRQDAAGRSAPRRLTTDDGAEIAPSWSSDGRSIVYANWDDEAGSTLRVRDARSGRERVVAKSGGVIADPIFSADGSRIAYRILDAESQMGGARDDAGVYVVDADGRNGRFLAPGNGVTRFSPDGRRLYFTGTPDYVGRRAVKLQSIALDGNGVRDHAYAETADAGDFALSPDLKWIAFKEINELHVMPFAADATAAVKITAQGNPAARRLTQSGGYELAWTADSRKLYWTLGPAIFSTAPGASGTVDTPAVTVKLTAPADIPTGTIAFTNARILPMTGADTIIESGTVVVERNRIRAVGPTAEVAVPRGAKVYDLTGKTLMPGLFDAHGHIDCCYGTTAMPQKHAVRYAALAYGVTTNFDPYANDLPSYETGEMTIAGRMVGPRWLTTGMVIYGRSGKSDRVFNRIANLEDARAIARRKTAIGGRIYKSYKLTTRAQKQWLLQAANEADAMIDAEGAGHFYDNVNVLLDGTPVLEHNLPVANYYDDLLQLFRASSTASTPTLIVTFGELFGENYIYQTQEPWKEAKVKTFIPVVNNEYNPVMGSGNVPLYVRNMHTLHQADELYDIGFRAVSRSIKRLDDSGVLINVGSHGQASGVAIHWEMALLAQGGMAPMRILRAATINGAKTWGLDHQIGSIEPGKLADLIVLDKNPLTDIRNANSVSYTMVNGRLYDSNTINEIGNRPRPRSKFYWELSGQNGIDWNPTWGEMPRER